MPLNLENEDANVNSTDLKKKPTKKTKEMLDENTRQIEELQNSQEELEAELSALEKEESALGEKSALNLKVNHKKFGEGVVTSQDGKYIEVKFADVTKKFVLPGCIADKFLEVEDESILEYYIKCNEIHEKKMSTELKIKSATYAIQRHEDAIERLKSKLK
jgi:predicted nuclease with TOPRIM domain